MNLDYTYLISLFSLLLRLFFLSLISFEIVLPRFRDTAFRFEWKSDFHTELKSGLVMAGSFALAIVFLIVLDIFSSKSPSLLVLNLLLDCLLLASVLSLLFLPKTYGLAEKGIYLNGLIIPWEEIEVAEKREGMFILKRTGWWREDKRLLLPADGEIRDRVLKNIKERIAIKDD